MSQFHFSPDSYLEMIRGEVPGYDELQRVVAGATAGPVARRILDLGSGTGETACAVAAYHADASLVLLDESAGMLAHAVARIPAACVERAIVGDLLEQLPAGPFDVVVSALAIHHLDGSRKQELFRRVAGLLAPNGVFVMGDVVVPEDPADAVTPLSVDYDLPDRLVDLTHWLDAASLVHEVVWTARDLVVIRSSLAVLDD
ncbi:MAG: class I SAM-dependent methyltransferase [Acidimicrobiia bacterium]